jgi:dethiobiotin synthetase
MHGLFFTGTDTGVGKTFVTAAVLRLLRRQGRSVGVCKPVATGAVRQGNRLIAEDSLILAAAAGHIEEAERITRYRFETAAAPPLAARQEGIDLRLVDVVQAVRECATGVEALLVEGVGGLLCPLTERETIADLVAALDMPAVVVARRALGTLNHTLMTVEIARARGLKVAGVVVSETTPVQGVAEETNVAELRRRLPVPVLAVAPFQQADPDSIAQVDWWSLAAGISFEPTGS